jgi:adenine-specific DNA-methyltransferase
MNLLDKLTDLLKKEEKFVINGKLLKNKIVESALKLDSQLIKLLLSDDNI